METPRLGLGERHAGVDAEIGNGIEIVGGTTTVTPASGLAVSLVGRGVLTLEAAGLAKSPWTRFDVETERSSPHPKPSLPSGICP